MKKMTIVLAAAALACSSVTAFAQEDASENAVTYAMEPETAYEIDLNGDGTLEKLSYKTYAAEETDENGALYGSQAVLELYENDQLTDTLTDIGWSYFWSVDQCQLEDGTTLLLASSHSDNDWTNQSLLLSYGKEGFEVLADLSLVSRETGDLIEEETNAAAEDIAVSAWGRCNGIYSAEGNRITVKWMDMSKATGTYCPLVTYEVADGKVTEAADIPVQMDAEETWTAWTSFEVLDSYDPENASVVYQVAVGDKVQLTEVIKIDGECYFKCINADGQEGWMPDAADYISEMNEDGSDWKCGYFEEAIYAG